MHGDGYCTGIVSHEPYTYIGLVCGKTTDTIESYSVGCGMTDSTVVGYALGCGMTTSTIVAYQPGCGMSDGQIIGANIVYDQSAAAIMKSRNKTVENVGMVENQSEITTVEKKEKNPNENTATVPSVEEEIQESEVIPDTDLPSPENQPTVESKIEKELPKVEEPETETPMPETLVPENPMPENPLPKNQPMVDTNVTEELEMIKEENQECN